MSARWPSCWASSRRCSRTLIGEQYKGKHALIAPNHQALHLGHDYARENLGGACGLKVERSDAVGDRIFVNGNDAAGLGCVYGGATVAAWYPITPSTSVAEAFAKHCKKFRVDAADRERTNSPSSRRRTKSPPSAR